MNRDRLERWLLLRETGELDPVRSRILDAYLKRDSALREFERDAKRLARLSCGVPPGKQAPHTEQMMISVRQAITFPNRRAEPSVFRGSALALRPAWATAMAGILAVASLAWLVVTRSSDRAVDLARTGAPPLQQTDDLLVWDDGFEDELVGLEQLLSAAAIEELFADSQDMDSEEQLIRQWLELEGITI